MLFENRLDAGKKLVKLLGKLSGKEVVVYALPRGGVIVGAEIAKSLGAPLDLIITRKIGHPYQKEYAIGAVAENGHSVFDEQILNIDEDYLISEVTKQKEEAKRRRQIYLADRKPVSSKGKIAVLVDDGIATGLTMKAAIRELKVHQQPAKIIVAVPVAPPTMVEELRKMGAELIAIDIPKDFLGAIGAYYGDFSPVSDENIIKIMKN